MPTDLQTIAQSAVRVRYKEPLLSEAMNKSQFVQPRGTYRGFNLGTSASALSVTVEVDPIQGDSVAVVHDVDDRALTIRITDPIDLDLSSFASKTVVLAIYARHLSQGTTVSAIRGYELSPSDEFTADPNVPNLIVLGTVVVPAAGLIADTEITHEKRVTSTDNEFPQRNRVSLVLNHDFRQSGYAAAPYDKPGGGYEGDIVPVGPHWFAEGGSASADDTGYKADGNGLIFQSSSAGDYEVRLYQDVSYTLGDIDASNGDWKLQFEVNYDVIAVSSGGDGTLEFRVYAVAPENDMGTYLIQKALDVSSVGTGFVASGLVDLVTLLPDVGSDLGTYGTARITTVMFEGSDALSQVSTDLYRINSVQVWIVNNPSTAGHVDPQARGDKGKGWPFVRGLSFMSRPAGFLPASATFAMDEMPRLGVSQSTRFGSGSVLSLENAALRLQETLAVEDNLVGADRNKPRYRAEYSTNVLTNILEAVSTSGDNADSGFRIVASPNGLLYITANADTATGVWDKDVDGDPAAAIRIDGNSGTAQFLIRAAGAGTWDDASWTSTINLLSKGVTATITDGTTHTDGDHNGPNAIDVVQTDYPAGRYFLRSGNHTLSAVSAITANTTLVGESDPLVSGDDQSFLIPNASMVSDQELQASLNSIHVRNGTSGRWDLTGSDIRNCWFEPGVLISSFPERMQFTNCRFGSELDGTDDAIAYTLELDSGTSSFPGIQFDNCRFDIPASSSTGVASVRIDGSSISDDGIGVTFRNCQFEGGAVVGANNGMAAVVISGNARAVFENCTFKGDCDDVFMVQVSGSDHLNGVVFRNCVIVSSSGKCMSIGGSSDTASVTLDNVTMVAGTSTPTGGKGQMFYFAGGGRFDVRNLKLLLNTSVIDTTVSPAFPPVEIGGVGGTKASTIASRCTIDGFLLKLEAGGVPTREVLLVHEMNETLLRNITCDVNGFAPSNNGLGTYFQAAYMSFVGSATNVVRMENIFLKGVDMPSHVDTRAGIYVHYGDIVHLHYDGPDTPTAAGGNLHNGSGAIYLRNSSASGVFVGRRNPPNPGASNTTRLVKLSATVLTRGELHSVGVDHAFRLVELGNSTVIGMIIDVSDMGGVADVFRVDSARAAIHNCLARNVVNAPSIVVVSSATDVSVTGNRFIMSAGFPFISLTGARCIVDSNILYATSGAPTITNTGTDSVTGDNVLS